MATLTLPIRMTIGESFEIAKAADRLATDPALDTVDARTCQMIGPLGAAMLAAAAARRSARITNIQEPEDRGVAAFCRQIGLWDLVVRPIVRGSTSHSEDTLRLRNLYALDPVYTHALAELLARNVDGVTEDASHLVQLCLNETLQNVFEHSRSEVGCFVQCRWYMKEGNLRIAVVDAGIGIAASLQGTAGNAQRNEGELVRDAVTVEGVTSRANRVGGLGLKTIRALTTLRAGRLAVITGRTKLVAREQGVQLHKAYAWAGTAIEIDFRPGMRVASLVEEFF